MLHISALNHTVTKVYTLIAILISLSLVSCSKPAESVEPASQEFSSARESASVLTTDSFEQGQLSSFWNKELHAQGAGLVVSEQNRVGKQAMRFSWKPSQYDGTNTSCHAELGTAALAKEDNERWYGFSLYLPAATMANDDHANLVQWHATPDAGYFYTVPPVSLALAAGNKILFGYTASDKPIAKAMQNPTSAKSLDLGVAKFDAWVDYVVHIKWDATGKTGVLQVWQDGKLVVDEQGVSVGYVNSRNFWKFGLYCWTGKSSHTERTTYYDEIRVGGADSNYDAVRPGRSDKTAK